MMLLEVDATEQAGFMHLSVPVCSPRVDSGIATERSRLRHLRFNANSKLAAPFLWMLSGVTNLSSCMRAIGEAKTVAKQQQRLLSVR